MFYTSFDLVFYGSLVGRIQFSLPIKELTDPGAGRLIPKLLGFARCDNPFYSFIKHDVTIGNGVNTWQFVCYNDKRYVETFAESQD
jgi:hypothetical protein